jgi:hypothetical protein
MAIVASLFRTPPAAHRAFEALRAAGIDPPQQVSVIARPDSASALARETVDELPVSTVGGAGLDALLGAAASGLVGAGALVLPGIGSVVVTGPSAAALGVADTTRPAETGAAALTGDLAHVLASWGIAEAEVREYTARVAQGDILLVVATTDDAAAGQAAAVLHQSGAERVTFGSIHG